MREILAELLLILLGQRLKIQPEMIAVLPLTATIGNSTSRLNFSRSASLCWQIEFQLEVGKETCIRFEFAELFDQLMATFDLYSGGGEIHQGTVSHNTGQSNIGFATEVYTRKIAFFIVHSISLQMI